MSRRVLGLDGGGTKTLAVIVDDGGRLLGQGTGGPSNYDDVGVDAARESIAQAVDAARQAAGLPGRPSDAAFLGLAGVVSPTDREIIHAVARDLDLAPAAATGIDHDCRIALAGGLSGRPGIVQIAGTGSSTFGVNAAGESWRAGGWGQLMDDEGSGYWLGVEALKAAVRAYDGRLKPTRLLDSVRKRLQLADMNDIMHAVYGAGLSRTDIAALAPLVIEAAAAGDPLAAGLLKQGGERLADCVLAVADKLGFTGRPCELALVGGMFRAGEIYAAPFRAAVAARLPACRIIPAELPPVLGAAVLALRQIGVGLDEKLNRRLHQAAAALA